MIAFVNEGQLVVYPRQAIVKAGNGVVLGYVTRANTDSGEVTVVCPSHVASHYVSVIEDLDPQYQSKQIGNDFRFKFVVKGLTIDVT